MNPWDRYKQKAGANPWERYAGASLEQNPDAQGTYQMVSKEGQSVYVPFGKVLDAGKYGFAITPDDFKRFTKDYTASLPMPDRLDLALEPSDESTWAGRGLNVFKGTAAGLAAPFTHPVASVASSGEPIVASGFTGMYPTVASLGSGQTGREAAAANRDVQSQAQADVAAQSKEMAEHPIYSAASIIGPAAVTEGVLRAVPHLPGYEPLTIARDALTEKMRTGLRNKFGGGEEFTERQIGKLGSDVELARQKAKAANEASEAARGKADEINAERQRAYEERKRAHRETVEAQKALHKEKLGKWQKKHDDAMKAHEDAARATQEKNIAELNKHIAERDEVARNNEAAHAMADAREGLETQIASDSDELHSRIEKAETDAKAANDAAWDAWRKAVGNPQVQPQTVVDTITAQEDKMNPAQVAEFRDILKRTAPTQADLSSYEQTQRQVMTGQGIPADVPYEKLSPDVKSGVDNIMQSLGLGQAVKTPPKEVPLSLIHGWKTQLENDIRNIKDGNVRSAVGSVLDAIRDLETDVTKAHGGANELAAARALHGPYKDTFVNPPGEPATVASTFEKGVNPEAVKSRAESERAAMLGRYDPEIPKVAEKVKDARRRLADLPSHKALRGAIKPIPKPPVPEKPPEMEEVGPPPKEPQYAKPPAAPSTKPYQEPKGTGSIPEAGDWTPERRALIKKNLKNFGATGQWAWRLIFGTAGEVALGMLHGGATEAVGRFGTSLIIGQGLIRLFSNILTRDSMLDWLAKPSAEDIRLIDSMEPHQAERLKMAIKGLAVEELDRNPKEGNVQISPAVAAFLGIGASEGRKGKPTLDELRKEMEERQPKTSRTQSRTPGVTHVYDPDQGKIVSVQ